MTGAVDCAGCRLTASSPFFGDYFLELEEDELGLYLKVVNNLLVVGALKRTQGAPGPAELAGVTRGALLVAINGAPTADLGQEMALERLGASTRPVTLGFRRLHAVRDTNKPLARRLWQGYLFARFTAARSWTGRFYVLREDGELSGYAGKDLEIKIETLRVAVGQELRLASGDIAHAARAMGDKGDKGGHGALDPLAFAVQCTEGKQWQFFKADCQEAKLDWVAAFTSLSISAELEASTSSHSSLTSPTASSKKKDTEYQGPATRAIGASLLEIERRGGRVIKQGALSMKMLVRRPGAVEVELPNMMKVALQKATDVVWTKRWFVLTEARALSWYATAPADDSEFPTGSLAAHQLGKPKRGTDEEQQLGFSIGRRSQVFLKLRARTAQDAEDWLAVLGPAAEIAAKERAARRRRMKKKADTDEEEDETSNSPKQQQSTPRVEVANNVASNSPEQQQPRSEEPPPAANDGVPSLLSPWEEALDTVPHQVVAVAKEARSRSASPLEGSTASSAVALDRFAREPRLALVEAQETFASLFGSEQYIGNSGLELEQWRRLAGQKLLLLNDAFVSETVFEALVEGAVHGAKMKREEDDSVELELRRGMRRSLSETVVLGQRLLQAAGDLLNTKFKQGADVKTGRSSPEHVGHWLGFEPSFKGYTEALREYASDDWDELRVRLGLPPTEVLVMRESLCSDSLDALDTILGGHPVSSNTGAPAPPTTATTLAASVGLQLQMASSTLSGGSTTTPPDAPAALNIMGPPETPGRRRRSAVTLAEEAGSALDRARIYLTDRRIILHKVASCIVRVVPIEAFSQIRGLADHGRHDSTEAAFVLVDADVHTLLLPSPHDEEIIIDTNIASAGSSATPPSSPTSRVTFAVDIKPPAAPCLVSPVRSLSTPPSSKQPKLLRAVGSKRRMKRSMSPSSFAEAAPVEEEEEEERPADPDEDDLLLDGSTPVRCAQYIITIPKLKNGAARCRQWLDAIGELVAAKRLDDAIEQPDDAPIVTTLRSRALSMGFTESSSSSLLDVFDAPSPMLPRRRGVALWAAVNLIRREAFVKAGVKAPKALLVCKLALAALEAQQQEDVVSTKMVAQERAAGEDALFTLLSLLGATSDCLKQLAPAHAPSMRDPDWLRTLCASAARVDDYKRVEAGLEAEFISLQQSGSNKKNITFFSARLS